MNLVSELAAERESAIADTRKLMDQLESDTRAGVERTGTCAPVVVALDGIMPEYWYPTWRNQGEKLKVFNQIKRELRSRHITGTVFALPGTLTPEDSTQAPEEIIMIVAHTAHWKEMRVLPWRKRGKGVQWAKRLVEHEFYSTLLQVPYSEES